MSIKFRQTVTDKYKDKKKLKIKLVKFHNTSN